MYKPDKKLKHVEHKVHEDLNIQHPNRFDVATYVI